MKKEEKPFTYKCKTCNRLSVDMHLGERETGQCAYCYLTGQVLEDFKKNKIKAAERDSKLKELAEEYRRKA